MIWRPVVGFEGRYEVSDGGDVRRVGSLTPRKAHDNGKGYLVVVLSNKPAPCPKMVHRLVAEAFIGPIQKGMSVNHLNCVKTDNRAVNLEIVTPGENTDHAWKHRTERPFLDGTLKRREGDRLVFATEASTILKTSREAFYFRVKQHNIQPAATIKGGLRLFWLSDIEKAAKYRMAQRARREIPLSRP